MDDGAPRCRVHERFPSIARCPACEGEACIFCWHVAAVRCDACLAKEPGGDAPAVPWETSAPLVSRFFATLLGAFRPQSTAAAFGRPEKLGASLVFALLTFPLPVMIVAAIELTWTVVFGNLQVRVVGHPSTGEIVGDFLHAIGVGLAIGLTGLLAVALPYVSLCRAYGRSPVASIGAMRVVLYRAWVLPAAMALLELIGVCLPIDAKEVVETLWSIALVVGFVELTLSLRSGARDAAVVAPWWMSWVVVLVPLALLFTLLALGEPYLARIVPHPVEQAAGAERDAAPPQRAISSNGSPR